MPQNYKPCTGTTNTVTCVKYNHVITYQSQAQHRGKDDLRQRRENEWYHPDIPGCQHLKTAATSDIIYKSRYIEMLLHT